MGNQSHQGESAEVEVSGTGHTLCINKQLEMLREAVCRRFQSSPAGRIKKVELLVVFGSLGWLGFGVVKADCEIGNQM